MGGILYILLKTFCSFLQISTVDIDYCSQNHVTVAADLYTLQEGQSILTGPNIDFPGCL